MPEIPERQPIAQASLSAVLVAFNVGAELEEAVAGWDEYLAGRSRPYEILIVNDGSTDDTLAHAEKLAGQFPQVRVLNHERHEGIGAALRTGFAQAQYPLLVSAAADKQFQPADLYRLLESIDQVDLITGYRVGRPIPIGILFLDALRSLLSRVFLGAAREPRGCWLGLAGWRRRWLANWIFGLRVRDPECPFRLYRREIIERLPIQCDSSAAQIEILAKANHLEFVMGEVPVQWTPSSHSYPDPVDKTVGKELRRLFSTPVFGKLVNTAG
jgi:glycosyltransferase involved in cell wall biosynthesis